MQEANKKHIITITGREQLSASEVLGVEYFTSEAVAAKTACGRLLIKGKNLTVDTMESKTGDLIIKGRVNELLYEDAGEGKSLMKKLFR